MTVWWSKAASAGFMSRRLTGSGCSIITKSAWCLTSLLRVWSRNAHAAIRGFHARLRRQGDAILAVGRGAEKSGSAAEAVRHDVAFHTFVYQLSGNPLIQPSAEAHWMFLRRVMIGVLLHAECGPLVWAQHEHILDALVAGDVDGAVSLATEHVTGAQNALLQAMASGKADHLFGAPAPDV